MRELILGSVLPRQIALVEDGKLCEWHVDQAGGETGRIILGSVERIVPGMNACFVRIGEEKNGFLPITQEERRTLRCGQEILVQVRRDAQGMKGAFLDRHPVLAGRFLLFLPEGREIGVSAKITDENVREALKRTGRALAGDGCGLVMRTSAADASEGEMREELEELRTRWEEILRDSRMGGAPRLLYAEDVLSRLLTDLIPQGIGRIVTSDPDTAERFGKVCPVSRVQEDPLRQMGLYRKRDQALQRLVWLDSGAGLVVDECEGLTVIDVNTQKFTGKTRDVQTTQLETNLEACDEIVRQVRLRNLSGIILIDMIDMETEENRQRVLSHLTECFRRDRVRTVIHGFTSLGLIEMTRKRTRRSLRSEICAPCPACHGQGYRILEEYHG